MGVNRLMTLVRSASRTADDAKWDSVRSRMNRRPNENASDDEVQFEDLERIDGLILRPKRYLSSLFKEAKKSGRSNVLVIDAQNVQHHFAHGFDWFCGGQHSEVEARVRRFVSALVEMGVRPVFVLNGPGCIPEAKVAEWCKRKKVIARMVQGIYQRGSLYSKEATNPSVFTCTCLALILSSLDGCELHISMPGVEDDYVAAEIAMETNAFGVISDDSDFLCFQMGDVKVFSGQDVNTLEAREYDIDALARYLGIQPSDLPLLAALTGNDMVSAKEDLATFHARICALEYNNNQDPEERGATSSGATRCTESHSPETQTLPDSYNELRCELCAVQMNSPIQAQMHYDGERHNSKVTTFLEQLMRGNNQLQLAPPVEDPVVIRPADTGRVSIRAVANEIAEFKNAIRILGDDVADELVRKVTSAVEWYELDSTPPPPSPFNPEMTDENWAKTVDVFCGKYLASDPPFPGYPIMVGYPVGIGVGAEDLTSAVTGLEPGFEFSKLLRWRTYGILLNEGRATGPKVVVELYAVSPEEVETKLAVPHYPTAPHPGLLTLHALGVGAVDESDPRWRLFAAAISPLLDHRALCHTVHRDDLKLFAFLYYFAHSEAEAEAAVARRLCAFEVMALVATHFAMRNNGRAAAEMGWLGYPGSISRPLREPKSLRAAHLNSLYVNFPAFELSAALNHPGGDPSIFLPSRNHNGRLFQAVYSDLSGLSGPSIWARFFDCLESHEQDRVEKILKYVDVKNRVRHLPGYLANTTQVYEHLGRPRAYIVL